MKNAAFSFITKSVVLVALTSSTSWAKVEFDSKRLLRDPDEVQGLVINKIKEATAIQAQTYAQDDELRNADAYPIEAVPEAVEVLKDGLRIALSISDKETMRTSLTAQVRQELRDLNSYDSVVGSLAQEAIDGLKSQEKVKTQATYLVLLRNLMSELKPEVKSNPTFKRIIEEIRDSNIVVPTQVKNDQALLAMARPISPSVTAESIVPRPQQKK